MLEVKDLYREYKPKKGSAVVALDHVSVKFPDKGLVFILGKSGSGKSTLLNVMGGLDKSDGGDIIIKGKSSKNFKQGDFDSYRNTYLGFIFQEYNILDEFNVGQNIALALELQGKKATTEKINEILEEVDLVGYGNRKTNELSGGQKQRVAIARALVKDPDIIFGDEPTGALDSKTGLAVFDTLKKLSEKKLVVVVSHDREFAELYGDRVIELADGKIISDIEKIKVAGQKVSGKENGGVTVIDQSVLKVDRNYELTDEDMAVIKKYLNDRKDQERLISLDDSINAPFRRITRIDELGNKESFRKTDEESIVNKKEDFRAIKSKLSLRKCFRIGGSSLKNKPFRLVITILLAITAFAMFGLSDTMGSYNKIDSTVKSITDYGGDSIAMSKEYYYKYSEDSDYFNKQDMKSSDTDITSLKDRYGIDFKGVYKIGYGTLDFGNYFKKTRSNYYSPDATYASGLYVSSNDEVRNNLGFTMTGNYPQNEGEIAITKFMYDSFKKYGFRDPYDEAGSLEPSDVTENQIIGKSLRLYTDKGDRTVKITGIIDTGFDSSKYSALETDNSNLISYMQYESFNSDYGYGYHSLFFTNDETVKTIVSKNIDCCSINYSIGYNSYNVNYLSVDTSEDANYVKYKTGTTKLENRQIGLSLDILYNMDLSSIMCNQFNYKNLSYYGGDEYHIDSTYSTKNLNQAINYLYNDENLRRIYTIEKNDSTYNESDLDYTSFSNYYSSLVNKIFTQDVIDNIINYIDGISVTLSYWNSIGSYDTKYALNDDYCKVDALILKRNNAMYFGADFIKSLNLDDGYYSFLIAKNNIDDDKVLELIKETYVDPAIGLVHYKIRNAVMPAYDNINPFIEELSQVFLYIGIGFAVFASLMIFNFITISISYKKREIGILRAVGARSRDVFNIFFAESFIIAMIAFAFAIGITFVISIVINNALANEYNLLITLLNPGVRQVLLVLGVSLGIAFISTLLPVYKIAMKRPIDAIRDR